MSDATTTSGARQGLACSDLLYAILNDGEWLWQTEDHHHDNNETMGEFLNHYLPTDFEVTLQDGTYAEIHKDGRTYEVHASGNGDPYHHRVEFSII